MDKNSEEHRQPLSLLLRQQRKTLRLTLTDLADQSGVSASHIGRIERGERFPSASVLKSLAKPLSLSESELMALAGFLTAASACATDRAGANPPGVGRLDPDIARMLAQEPVAIQRAAIGVLTVIKNLAKVADTAGS